MNKFVYDPEYGWSHRSLIKVTINPILRSIQFFTNKPWVIASECVVPDDEGKVKPSFIRYVIMRVKQY